MTGLDRPSTTSAGPARPVGFCADIGGTHIKFAEVGPDATCGPPRREATPARDWAAFCATLERLCGGQDRDLPLSLSIAGVVDPETGVALSANVPCTSGRRLAFDLGHALGRPVRVANDADCFALAEARRGAAAGHRIVFGIILGTGVGGGLVIDGRIVEGAGGIAGEWGHGPLLGAVRVGDAMIPPLACGCGQTGCLDTLGSARGLERLDAPRTGGRDSRAILAAWAANEPDAVLAVDAWLALLAGPLAVMVNTIGPSLVPVGGGLSNDRALMAELDTAVRHRILRRSPAPIVLPATLGDAAGMIGAALRLAEPAPAGRAGDDGAGAVRITSPT